MPIIKATTKNMEKRSHSTLNNMKEEIAAEQGVSVGKNATARENGKVGGEMTKRMLQNSKKKSNN